MLAPFLHKQDGGGKGKGHHLIHQKAWTNPTCCKHMAHKNFMAADKESKHFSAMMKERFAGNNSALS